MDTVRTITIDLVRHAPSIYEKGTLPLYDADIDLTDQASITALAHALPEQSTWLISPLTRCRKTAEALKSAGASPITEEIMNTLEEQRYGEWHGRPVVEIWDHIKDGLKSNWHFLHPTIRPPKGESFDDLIIRLTPFLKMITSSDEKHIVIIAHAMVIRALVGMALGFDSSQSLAMNIENLSRTTLTYMSKGHSDHNNSGGRWYLDRLNETYG